MTGSTSTPAGRAAFESFLSQAAGTRNSSETETTRIITQICVVEHVRDRRSNLRRAIIMKVIELSYSGWTPTLFPSIARP